MHSFKKGDLVEYVARGLSPACIATVYKVDEANEDIYVEIPGVCTALRWEMSACRPAPDYTKLVEAAKNVVLEWEQKGCPITSLGCECEELRDALADLNAHPEYRWLIGEGDGSVGKANSRPKWGSCGYEANGYKAVEPTPSFVKPRQLWERKFSTMCADGKARIDIAAWNGYWWELAEDHGKRCENCKHYAEFRRVDIPNYGANVCMKADKTNPEYGMGGCKYEPKVDK